MCEKTKNKKNNKNKNDLLDTHISEMAKAIFFKFVMWGGLPGGHLCSKTCSNRMKDHGATKV